MMKIVLLDSYAMNPGDLDLSGFNQFGQVTDYPRTAPEQVVERSLEADILIINKVKLTEEVLSQLPNLKLVVVSATGYNVVDAEAARRHGIIVTNVPAYSTDSVAQLVFAHLLNITDQVAHYAQQNREGRWSKNPDFCYQDGTRTDLVGKTMAIVGLGNIGQRVAQIALAFGLKL